jgi:beta-lactam-binding protein with PASTA domain
MTGHKVGKRILLVLTTVLAVTCSAPAPTEGPEQVDVPNVRGMALEEAEDLLRDTGLLSETTTTYSKARVGTVLRQDPAPGVTVDLGASISLVIARLIPKVPSVVGKKVGKAQDLLEGKGYKVRTRREVSSRSKGTVISQAPSAGTRLRPGRRVTLVVAKPDSGPDCQGYSPCITPGPDVDCAGGSGDGPRYVDGPVYVSGSDPYDLDADGDGVGCES